MKIILLSAFFLLVALFAHGQFTDSTTHLVRLSVTGNGNRSNNTTAYLFNNDVRFSVKNRHTTLNTAAAWLYGEQGGNLTNNDFNTTADFNLYRDSSKLYYWALANFTTSYSLKIRSQLQGGLGAAYNFVNNTNAWLNLSEGILYEASRLRTADAARNTYQTFRNSLRLSYRFLVGKAVTFTGANYFQQAIGDGNDYILRTTNSVNIKLNKWIGLGANVAYNRYKRTGSENLLVTYGVVAEKYF